MDLHVDEKFLSYYNQDVFAKTASSVMLDFAKSDPKKVFEAKEILMEKHPHNITVHNTIKFFLHKLNQRELGKHAKEKHYEVIKSLNTANKDLAKLGAKKIRPGSTVLVHSLNNQVFEILKEAANHKNFRVHVFDHAPFSFGKVLSEKLREKEIECKLFPDTALSDALEQVDICLLGADALSAKGAVAKHGSKIIAHHSQKEGIPVYACGHSWKYTNKPEMFLDHEHEHGHHDHKKAYEALDTEHSIISELGIFKPEHFASEARFYNSWQFM